VAAPPKQEQIRPLVDHGREFKDAVAEVFRRRRLAAGALASTVRTE